MKSAIYRDHDIDFNNNDQLKASLSHSEVARLKEYDTLKASGFCHIWRLLVSVRRHTGLPRQVNSSTQQTCMGSTALASWSAILSELKFFFFANFLIESPLDY